MSYKHDRVAEDIRREITLCIRELKDPRIKDKMLTVVRVEVSSDASFAKVYVSVFPSDKQDTAMGIIQDNIKALRGELGRKVGKQLRIVPELVFYLDTTLDYAEHIDELLRQ